MTANPDLVAAIIVVAVFPLPIGAATLLYCRRWGFMVWGVAAVLAGLNLYGAVRGWMESGFLW